MKILQISSPDHAGLIEMAEPVPGPGEVLVRVEAVASCPHWDMTLMDGRDMFHRPGHPRYPIPPGQPGHEMTGVVEAVGPEVVGFEVGEPVVAWRTMGESKPGYYAEKACVPTEDLLHRPSSLSAAEAAGLEMAMCVACCFLVLPNLSGQRVSIGGLGPAGMIAVQMARAAGAARVIGFDPIPERCAFALSLGADEALDPTDAKVTSLRASPGAQVDYAIDCSGSAASVQFQMDIVGKGVALFGVQHEPYLYQPRHWYSGLTVYGYPGHSLKAAQYAMQRLESGEVRLAPLNSVELPLSRFADGTALLAEHKALKVLYRPENT